MSASHGENFPRGIHGHGSFDAINAYFEQRTCRVCNQPYRAEGVQFVREEPGVVVVKVDCTQPNCGQPLGIALVAVQKPMPEAQFPVRPAPTPAAHKPRDWNKRDVDRLGQKPKINYDDVLSAHEFFQNLGDDWAKHLPTIGAKKAAKSQ